MHRTLHIVGAVLTMAFVAAGVTVASAQPAPPAGEPPAEQPPAEQPPAAQPPAEQPPAQPPAEPPTEGQPPAEGQPPTDAPAEPPAESAPPSDAAPDEGASPPADAPGGESTAGAESGEEKTEAPAGESAEKEGAEGEETDAAGKAAATEQPDAAQEPAEGEEEIVITGSRIKRKAQATPSAVQVIDSRQLKYSGAQNMSDVLQYLTASSGGAYRGLGAGSDPKFGAAQLNLYGLGPGATLVLLNGRRIVPSGAGVGQNFVDMNTIPISAIDRVEILKGGASALYGSDAIAGVVNVITRKDWNGARFTAGQQTTDDFDQGETTWSAAAGGASDRGSALLSIDYDRLTPLMANDRDFTRGTNVSLFGQPGSYLVDGQITPDPACVNDPPPGSALDANGEFCTIDRNPWVPLGFSETERWNLFGSGEYDLTRHLTAFVEGGYAQSRLTAFTGASFPMLQEVNVPADHVDNPFGTEIPRVLGRPLGLAYDADLSHFDSNTFRVAGGLRGDFEDAAEGTIFETWGWETSVTHGESQYLIRVPDVITERLQSAINSCSDPGALSGCFNPFHSAVDGTGTPNSQAVIDSFMGQLTALTTHRLTTFDAGLNGSLTELPGGDLGFAVGGQFRHEERESDVDHDSEQQAYMFLIGNSDAFAERDTGAGYAELALPFLEGLEVQTAGRFEAVENVGSALTPKFGVNWRPSGVAPSLPSELQQFRVRGSVAWGYRAPALYETGNGQSTTITQFDQGGVAVFRGTRRTGNPDLDPETAIAYAAGIQWSPFQELGLEVDFWHYDYDDLIKPENAVQIFTTNPNDPRVVYDSTGNFLGVNVTNQNVADVTTNGIDWVIMYEYEIEKFDKGSHSFGVGSTGTFVNSYKIPKSQVEIDPATGENVAPMDCDPGNALANPDLSCEVSGWRNFQNFVYSVPKLRVNVPINWTYDQHALTLIPHFISGYRDDDDLDDGTFDDIDPWLTFDLQYAFSLREVIGELTTLRVGANNLFDADPPFVRTQNGYDFVTHDPRGRLLYVKLAQDF